MVLQEHQSSSRSCWRPQPGVMGPRHFLGAFKISPAFFFGGKKKKQTTQVVKSSLFSRNYTNPQNLGISRSMLPSWGVFVWSDGVFPTPNSSTENPTHFCVSPGNCHDLTIPREWGGRWGNLISIGELCGFHHIHLPFVIIGYGSIPINTIFRGMNIHLPAILMFTRGTRF